LAIRFRLGFWPKFEPQFHHQVPLFRQAFRSILQSVNAEEREILTASSGQPNFHLLQLADAFGRFRILAEFGLIREEDEKKDGNSNGPNGEYGENAVNGLRELLWRHHRNPPKEIVQKCLRQMAAKTGQFPMAQKCRGKAAMCHHLTIGPNDMNAGNFEFASFLHPSHIPPLLAHGHCAGLQLRWNAIFPLPKSALHLLSLVPLPPYKFDRTKRFWMGRDAWAENLLEDAKDGTENAEINRQQNGYRSKASCRLQNPLSQNRMDRKEVYNWKGKMLKEKRANRPAEDEMNLFINANESEWNGSKDSKV
jgi:hypothetical protein